jgi:hypothetical protein
LLPATGFMLVSCLVYSSTGDMFSRNVGRHSTDYKALYIRRKNTSVSNTVVTLLQLFALGTQMYLFNNLIPSNFYAFLCFPLVKKPSKSPTFHNM